MNKMKHVFLLIFLLAIVSHSSGRCGIWKRMQKMIQAGIETASARTTDIVPGKLCKLYWAFDKAKFGQSKFNESDGQVTNDIVNVLTNDPDDYKDKNGLAYPAARGRGSLGFIGGVVRGQIKAVKQWTSGSWCFYYALPSWFQPKPGVVFQFHDILTATLTNLNELEIKVFGEIIILTTPTDGKGTRSGFHQICLTYNGSLVQVYQNNAKIVEFKKNLKAIPGNFDKFYKLWLGGAGFRGFIDQVMVCDYDMSQSMIEDHWAGTRSLIIRGLVNATELLPYDSYQSVKPSKHIACGRNQYWRQRQLLEIVGGLDSNDHEFPFHVMVFRPADKRHPTGTLCGGAIIDRHWVITAAHCCPIIEIVYGFGKNVNFQNYFDTEKATKREIVVQSVLHPLFNESSLRYDFCLLKTLRPLYDDTDSDWSIQPICLTSANCSESRASSMNNTLIATGLGFGSNKGTRPPTLRHNYLPIVNQSYCEWFYEANLTNNAVFCAGNVVDGGEGTCEGDSGGPLFSYQDGHFILEGLSSFVSTRGCAEPFTPGGYAKVCVVREWIEQVIGRKFEDPIAEPQQASPPTPTTTKPSATTELSTQASTRTTFLTNPQTTTAQTSSQRITPASKASTPTVRTTTKPQTTTRKHGRVRSETSP